MIYEKKMKYRDMRFLPNNNNIIGFNVNNDNISSEITERNTNHILGLFADNQFYRFFGGRKFPSVSYLEKKVTAYWHCNSEYFFIDEMQPIN